MVSPLVQLSLLVVVYNCLRCGSAYGEKLDFCCTCGMFKTIYSQMTRQADTLFRGKPEMMTAAELVKKAEKRTGVDSYPGLVFGARSLVGLYGPPGSGKSTMLYRIMNDLQPSLLLSLEEGLSATVSSKLRWLEILADDLDVVYPRSMEEVDGLLSDKCYRALGVDSLSASQFTADDLRRISVQHDIPVFATLQVTKAMDPAGPMSMIHGLDIVVGVFDGKWAVTKSRFGLNAGGAVNG